MGFHVKIPDFKNEFSVKVWAFGTVCSFCWLCRLPIIPNWKTDFAFATIASTETGSLLSPPPQLCSADELSGEFGREACLLYPKVSMAISSFLARAPSVYSSKD